MTAKKEHLFVVFENLIKIKSECSCEIFSECGVSDITVKQIGYLKAIDKHGEITFSRLAKITKKIRSRPLQRRSTNLSKWSMYTEKNALRTAESFTSV